MAYEKKYKKVKKNEKRVLTGGLDSDYIPPR